jgi:hypothetical protein
MMSGDAHRNGKMGCQKYELRSGIAKKGINVMHGEKNWEIHLCSEVKP